MRESSQTVCLFMLVSCIFSCTIVCFLYVFMFFLVSCFVCVFQLLSLFILENKLMYLTFITILFNMESQNVMYIKYLNSVNKFMDIHIIPYHILLHL